MRDYNLLTIKLEDYEDFSELREFLEALSNELGYYDTAKTIKVLTYDWINNDNSDYVIKDMTQQINMYKLHDAFTDYSELEEVGHYDDNDDWIVDKELEDMQHEFIVKLVNAIRHSNIQY